MVMMALGLVAFLGLASLAIDMGHLYVTRNELQNVADAAALAGARQLIDNSSGTAVVDSAAAQTAAMSVAQTQAQLSGLATLPNGSRTDLTIAFGNWNIYAGSGSAWTATDGSAGSNSNAVQVTIQRATGTAYGPVTNFLAGILGIPTSQVSATATAYLGFANATLPGGVTLPIGLPTGALTAFNQDNKSWWAQWLGPKEAFATGTQTIKFYDYPVPITSTASSLTNNTLGTTIPHLISENNDEFTNTPINHIACTSSASNLAVGKTLGVTSSWSVTAKTPMPALTVGEGKSGTTQLYAGSEWEWADRTTAIFDALNRAYTTNKNSSNKWRVMLPVYTQQTAANPTNPWLWRLAQLFSFGPSPAYACMQFTPNIQVVGFTVADVTAVNYNSSCNQCSGLSGSQLLTCLNNNTSCARSDYATIVINPDSNYVAPPGTNSGGPDNSHISSSGSVGNGTYAITDVKLVQ